MCDNVDTCTTSALDQLYKYQTHGQRGMYPQTYFGIKQDFPNDGIIGTGKTLFEMKNFRSSTG